MQNSKNQTKKKTARSKKKNLQKSTVFAIIFIIMAFVLIISAVVRYSSNKKEELPNNNQSSSASTDKVSSNITKETETTSKPTTTQPSTEVKTTSSNVTKNEGHVDSSGNVTFSVTNYYRNTYSYCVAVNRQQNVVTVYGKNSNGEYNVPVKAILCSCGVPSSDGGILTPTGTFNSMRKDRWLLLLGNCWGQYTTQVVGSIFFHSVPYYTQDQSNLQYNEFPKLGTSASHGCIRVSTGDAKWLYDNLGIGTVIYIYDSNNPGPLGKPNNVAFDVNSANRGWDPTDPDTNNPWNR